MFILFCFVFFIIVVLYFYHSVTSGTKRIVDKKEFTVPTWSDVIKIYSLPAVFYLHIWPFTYLFYSLDYGHAKATPWKVLVEEIVPSSNVGRVQVRHKSPHNFFFYLLFFNNSIRFCLLHNENDAIIAKETKKIFCSKIYPSLTPLTLHTFWLFFETFFFHSSFWNTDSPILQFVSLNNLKIHLNTLKSKLRKSLYL